MIYLTFVNSFHIWSPKKMKTLIIQNSLDTYGKVDPEQLLNRTYESMYLEWWIHNLGYYITAPFCKNKLCHHINIRCKDLDLKRRGSHSEEL